MALGDWADVLSTLPQFAVDEACASWMRGETKRPTPADICNRAIMIVTMLRTEAESLTEIAEQKPVVKSAAARARMAAAVRSLAAGGGP